MAPIHTLNSVSSTSGPPHSGGEDFTSMGGSSGTAVHRKRNDNDDTQTRIIAQMARNQTVNQEAINKNSNERTIGVITLYKNGFQIGNQQTFRNMKEPENAKFLRALQRGEMPKEMERMCREEWGEQVDTVGVQIIDKTNEDFVEPKPKFDFAKSQGKALGGSATETAAAARSGAFGNAQPKLYIIDPTQPTTTLQIVLHTRNRVKETFNQNMTVLELYQHIMAVTKQSRFDLLTGFPPKPLSDPNITLKDAGLLNASIQQKL